jgi:hypothetical protein
MAATRPPRRKNNMTDRDQIADHFDLAAHNKEMADHFAAEGDYWSAAFWLSDNIPLILREACDRRRSRAEHEACGRELYEWIKSEKAKNRPWAV